MARKHTTRRRESSEAIAWDDGCVTDPVRNEFLVPKLTQIFERERPSRILDIGAGTGYIPRIVDTYLGYRPQWTLVDINCDRLYLAEERKPPVMQMRCLVGSMADIRPSDQPFQSVLLTFTLLEAADVDSMLSIAIGLLSPNGLLIIAMPDIWMDVVAAMGEEPTLLGRLLNETISLDKIDKFTGETYPFYATRIESLISAVLNRFCSLEYLEKGGPQGEVYLFVFRKRLSFESGLTGD